jgi:membrane protease YdiL (CAAX protease family)
VNSDRLRSTLVGFLWLAFAALTWCVEPWFRHAIMVDIFGVSRIGVPGLPHTFAVFPFTLLLIIRLALYGFLFWALQRWLVVAAVSRHVPPWTALKLAGVGVATGTSVMVLAILAIVFSNGGELTYSGEPYTKALGYAVAWLGSSLIGAASEEVFFRGLLFCGLRAIGGNGLAVIVSAVAFAWIHLDNPGVSSIWLVRLFLQGLLLGYAVVRTRSLAWPIGYHAGWNWASAPLFGAAGSGYGAEGHVLSFVPGGPGWLDGGAVGPEGSVFAFAAMGLALLALRRETWSQGPTLKE